MALQEVAYSPSQVDLLYFPVGKQLSLYGVRAVLSLASYIKIAKHMLQSSRASVLPAERFIDSVNNTESPVFMVRQCL